MKAILSLLCALTLASIATGTNAQQNDGLSSVFGDSPPLLPPEEAFKGNLELDGDALMLSFNIEDGYYLYRDKFTIAAQDPAISIGEPAWPKAQIFKDDYFGDSAIYRNDLAAVIPVQLAGNDTSVIDVTFQGCADIGVCFPPTTASFTIAKTLPQPITDSVLGNLKPYTSSQGSASSSSSILGDSSDDSKLVFGGNNDELLHPSEAYRPFVENTSKGINVVWQIEPGYYLYKDKLSYSIKNTDGEDQTIVSTVRAEGETYKDEFFGETQIYRLNTSDQLSLANGSNGQGEITLNYQGCADIGVCFPPEQLSIPVTWNVTESTDPIASDTAALAASNGASGSGGLGLSEQDRLASQLATSSLWVNAAAFYIIGLLLAFTPCVLPMIPILSSIILGGGEKQTTGQAFRLSVIYVIGMALTYTLVGVLVGLSGYNIQAWFQNPWILSSFAILFVVFALAMFGVYELQLPSGLQTKLANISNKQSGGHTGGVFVMGILSALIVGPCVTAPLMGALIYIATAADWNIGRQMGA